MYRTMDGTYSDQTVVRNAPDTKLSAAHPAAKTTLWQALFGPKKHDPPTPTRKPPRNTPQ